MSVLILAEDIDATCDGVITALAQRGETVHRINTAWFPAQLSVSAELRGERWTGHLRTPGRVIDLEEITAVWYRTPRAYQFPSQLSPAEKAHANLEAKYGLGGVLSSLPVLWVNHPGRLADSAYKPVQLVTAAQCGLLVPDSVITNEADTVREFAAGGKTITKLFGANTILEEGVRKISFTRQLDDADLADLRGIETTIHLAQRWVPKSHDVRMVVIGEHITAATIRAGSLRGYVDFRSDYDTLTYELIEPPAEICAGVRRLMTEMGLAYGALDFVVRPDQSWVFLEFTDRSETCTWRSSRRVTEASRDRLPARFGTFVLFGCRDGVCSADGVGRGSEGSGDQPGWGLAVVDGVVARGCGACAGGSFPAAA